LDLCQKLDATLGEMVFAVGAFYGAPDAEIERRPAGWLYDRHQRVARERYDRSVEMGVTLETGRQAARLADMGRGGGAPAERRAGPLAGVVG